MIDERARISKHIVGSKPTVMSYSNLSKGREALIRAIVPLIFLLASDDILFVVDVFGQSLRLAQGFEVILIINALLDGCLHNKMPQPLSIMFVVFMLNTLFIPATPDLLKSLGYDAWFLIDLMTVWAIAYFVDRAYSTEELVRWYISSFVIMAMFGIVQLLLFRFGINLLVSQTINSSEGRINGLCFEPSYYSTYLLGGWSIGIVMLVKGAAKQENARPLVEPWQLAVISAALILSTSKLAWMGMLFLLACIEGKKFVGFLNGKRLTRAEITIIILMPFLLLIAFILFKVLIQNEAFVSKYFSGSGLLGTASHSYDDRMRRIKMTWQTFTNHFAIGTSFGGIDWAIDQQFHLSQTTGEAIGSFLEFGIAAGLIGLIAAFAFFKKLLWELPRQNNIIIITACAAGCFMQLLFLQANQNILRVWLWAGIGVLVALLNSSKLCIASSMKD